MAICIIINSEKHNSIHVKHHVMDSKYNIIFKELTIYLPFDCEIFNISTDYIKVFYI